MPVGKPWRKFYPDIWLADLELRRCSPGARGVWIDICCMAWLSPDEGYLVDASGVPITEQEIGFTARTNPGETHRFLEELERQGVLHRDDRGAIYSRRAVRDASLSKVRSEAGRKGGNPLLIQTDNQEDNQVALPSSASASASDSLSSSSSQGESEGEKSETTVLAFWAAYPRRKRTGMNKVIAAWSECISEGADPEVMVAKAAEYASSSQGRSQYAVTAPRFLGDRMYLDPPEAWERQDEGNGKPQIDHEALARRVAERNAKEIK